MKNFDEKFLMEEFVLSTVRWPSGIERLSLEL